MPNKEQNAAADSEETTQQGGSGPTPTSNSGQAPKPATMEVPVDKMASIMESLEALQKRDAERDEEIAILRESVSRGRLDEAEEKRKPKGPPRAQVMLHNGKIVTGWQLVKNELIYDVRNMLAPVNEDIQIKVKYSDGEESGAMKYIDFVRNKVRATVFKVAENGIMWVVRFDDPNIHMEDLEIDPQFLNP